MAKLVYSSITSLDGYVEDAHGRFGWAKPDEEVHAFINELMRPVGTYLYGRRMYETMVGWETTSDPAPVSRDFASIWRAADKVVFSRTLQEVGSSKTRILRDFDADAVGAMLAAAGRDVTVGGPGLASAALAHGLVDEYRVFVVPFVTGGGKPSLPAGVSTGLRLLEARSFAGGVVYLRYAL